MVCADAVVGRGKVAGVRGDPRTGFVGAGVDGQFAGDHQTAGDQGPGAELKEALAIHRTLRRRGDFFGRRSGDVA